MINLKLARYDLETGKFERFLELGKDFVYGGDYILITEKMTMLGVWGFGDPFSFKKDQQDPLWRFNGLFNGRTYGEGRFVLVESKIIDRFGKKIVMSQDDVFKYNKHRQVSVSFDNFHYWQETESQIETNNKFKILGNLHENPELYEKIK